MAFDIWQLYDRQGRPIAGRGGHKTEVVVKGMLHASAHVWLWRRHGDRIELAVQQRAYGKINWPGRFDKSAGGHVLLGEAPAMTAIRKTQHELGCPLQVDALQLIGVNYWVSSIDETGLHENEFQWLYLAPCPDGALSANDGEVLALSWLPTDKFWEAIRDKQAAARFVPYGRGYFALLRSGVEQLANLTSTT